MLNSGHTNQNSDAPTPDGAASGRSKTGPRTGPARKRSLAEWLRTATRDLFQLPGEPAAASANWYAGLVIAPGVSSTADEAAFTSQISRLHTALSNPAPESRRVPGLSRQMTAKKPQPVPIDAMTETAKLSATLPRSA